MDSKMYGNLHHNRTRKDDDRIATPPWHCEGYGSNNGPGQPSTMYILIPIQQFNIWLLFNAEG